jgi:hypothetical protein
MAPEGQYVTAADGSRIWREDRAAAEARKAQFIHIETLKEQRKTLQNDLKEQQKIYLENINTINNYEKLTAAIADGNAKDIREATSLMEANFITAENGTKEMLRQQVTDMEKHYDELRKAVAEGAPGVSQEMVNGAYTAYMHAKAEYEKCGESLGENITDSVALGIKSKFDTLAGAAKGAIEGVFGIFNKTAEIHSPSKRGLRIGGNIGGSVGLGIIGQKDKVTKQAEDVTEAALNAFGKSSKAFSFGFAKPGTGLFAQSNNISAYSYNTQLGAILGKLDAVCKTIENNAQKEIRMDTGALVGATVSEMDRQLGRVVSQRKRGV